MWATGSGSPPPFFGREAHPAKPSWLHRLWNILFHGNELYRRKKKKNKKMMMKKNSSQYPDEPSPD
jgi:hypothetical protein